MVYGKLWTIFQIKDIPTNIIIAQDEVENIQQ